MSALKDISGQVFDKLTVVERHKENLGGKAQWICQCECGTVVNRTLGALNRSPYNFCGYALHPTKICTKCKEDKLKSEYHKSNGNPQTVCKKCKREFYKENKEKILERQYKIQNTEANKKRRADYSKKRRVITRQREIEYKKEYNQRPDVIARRNETHNRRKLTDMNYVLKKRLRGRVRDIIREYFANNKKYKYQSSLIMLGCDIEFFKAYIESKFEKGMNWERIAYIDIDHIKPCSQFDLTNPEEQKKCFHYTNLQPLWFMDNRAKWFSYNGD